MDLERGALGLVGAAAVVGADVERQPWKLVLLPAFWVLPGAMNAVFGPNVTSIPGPAAGGEPA